jgi:hypothetical protein
MIRSRIVVLAIALAMTTTAVSVASAVAVDEDSVGLTDRATGQWFQRSLDGDTTSETSFADFYAERLGTSRADVADTAEDMIDTYVELFGLDRREAETQAALDMLGGDMRQIAVESMGSVFAGSWIQRDPHAIVFAFTSDGERYLEELLAIVGVEEKERFRAVPAEASLESLRVKQLELLGLGSSLYPYESADQYEGFESSIDEIGNSVVIYGPDPDRYRSDLGPAGDSSLVRYENRNLSRPACPQANCDPSIFGGLSTVTCTTGYTVVKSGSSEAAITTAAHCSGRASHGGEFFWGSTPLFEQQSGQIDTELWSLLEREWVPKDDVWESDFVNRDIATVQNYWTIMLGAPVWKVGRVTQKTTGTIAELFISISDVPGSNTGIRATNHMQKGDSGGPVYYGSNAYGTIWGYSFDGSQYDTIFFAAHWWNGTIGWSIATSTPSTPTFDWYLKNSHSGGTADYEWQHGAGSWVVIAGDWSGNGEDQPGVYYPPAGRWDLHERQLFTYGAGSGNYPISGDWDGDGDDEVGYYVPSTQRFYRYGASGSVLYGNPGDRPISGDWDGDGDDDIGVWRPSQARFYLRDMDTGATTTIDFGNGSDLPLAGDWDGGPDEIGVYRPSNQTFYLRKANATTLTIPYGNSGDVPIVGNWDGYGSAFDTIGVIR